MEQFSDEKILITSQKSKDEKVKRLFFLTLSLVIGVSALALLSIGLLGIIRGKNFELDDGERYDKFDYFLLTLRWPPTTCLMSDCVANYTSDWMIHGLWPQYDNGKWPSFCNYSHEFNENLLNPIRMDLETYWPNLELGKTASSLWEHEWLKHGSCSARCSKTRGELNYFTETLTQSGYYPISDWLANKSVVPQSLDKEPYSLNHIHDVIEEEVGFVVSLECIRRAEVTKYPIWMAMSICLDGKTLEPFDCPKNQRDKDCDDRIIYPQKVKKSI